MSIPSNGFVIRIKRERVEQRGAGSGLRYRTVGHYECFLDGKVVSSLDLRGATVEPRGPGNNGKTGTDYRLRIEAGTYQLGTHGFPGSKYHTFIYENYQKPRPGVYVHDTNVRSAILIHRGTGFKSTRGCINLTGSIVGPNDNISPNISFKRVDAFIKFMEKELVGFPKKPGYRIKNAWVVIEGEP